MSKAPLTLYLAAPRGFCAGVDRAIKIVEMAIEKWGAPVYVRHEIVHNKFVVDGLRDKGSIFVEELDECPTDRPVIFSAHGVPKSVPNAAEARKMVYVDATCPLQVRVVERNEDTIGAAVDVSFEIPVPQGDGVLEGGQCVLGRLQVATAMRERDRTFVIEIRVAAHAQIARPAAFQYSSLDNVVGVAVILYDHICDRSRMAMPPTFS